MNTEYTFVRPIQAVPLEFDKYLGSISFLLFNSHFYLRNIKMGHEWLRCSYFSLPTNVNPMLNQQLTEVILPPIQNTARMCKHVKILAVY